MKKSLVFMACLLTAAFFHPSSATPLNDTIFTEKAPPIRTVVININAEIILTEKQNLASVSGSKAFLESIVFRQENDTLFINRLGRNHFREQGIIYLPVIGVQQILVNSEAFLKSLSALHVPELDIVVNGACAVAVSSLGKLTFKETASFAFEHTIEVRQAKPAAYTAAGRTQLAFHH